MPASWPPSPCPPQDDLADVQHRLATGGASQPAGVPPLAPPVAKGSMVDVFGNVVPPIALDQARHGLVVVLRGLLRMQKGLVQSLAARCCTAPCP